MKKIVLSFFAFAFIFISSVFVISYYSQQGINAVNSESQNFIAETIILDAGHGGEDGGAVAADGTVEKDLNLMITKDVAAYFELFGIPYIPVRTEDISVCDEGLGTIRERKSSDILNRFALVNSIKNSILLSIHQNFYSDAKYSGTQVFYSDNNDSSKLLAGEIRKSVVEALAPDNTRKIKPSDSSIYLLYKAQTTSVLVECGFISNSSELEKLKSPVYDSQLAYFIFKGLLNYLNN
ncbi:MAG: N-acetylmuramoyl-L-alanine amidase [Oscillospiraceae bacterium]|nr:N-acetylmuramoyl-L-alanine amidase [Oscillospiraceae bacterium]